MKEKPITPYERLLREVRSFAGKVKYAHRKMMWMYPKERLSEGWRLTDLYERTKAADQLDYDAVLVADDSGLKVMYKKRPDVPFNWA